MSDCLILPSINVRVKLSDDRIVSSTYRRYLRDLSFGEVLDVCNYNVFLSGRDPIRIIFDNGVKYTTVYGLSSPDYGLFLFTEETFPEHVSSKYPNWKADFVNSCNADSMEYEEIYEENLMEPDMKHRKKYEKIFDPTKLDITKNLKKK